MLAGQSQTSGAVDNERPPYIEFEEREIEDRAQTIATGHYSTKDRTIAIIVRPGSRDTLEKWADEYLVELQSKARQGTINPLWYPAIKAKYDEYKNGSTGTGLTGTPLVTWPIMSKSQVKMFVNAGIKTVEDLADVPDSELQNIGTGAMAMKQRARLWLQEASGTGKLVERQADLERKLGELADLVKSQAQALAEKDAVISSLTESKGKKAPI